MAQSGAYFYVIVESYHESGGGLHGPIHIRPVSGQGISTKLRVECSKDLSYKYPVGTRFRIKAKLTDRKGEGKFLYSNYNWPFDIISSSSKANVYGLKNCDTCKRVRKELDAAEVAYEFHDIRDEGVTKAQVTRWAKRAGWEKMLNKSSTTWRGLTEADKTGLGEAKAIALMAANPTLIKRPLITRGDTEVFVGWTNDVAAAVKG